MPSVRDIRRRIRSVENTAKITKAMSMIAASKMRRAQEMALRGRPYSERMRSLLADLGGPAARRGHAPSAAAAQGAPEDIAGVDHARPRAHRRAAQQDQPCLGPVRARPVRFLAHSRGGEEGPGLHGPLRPGRAGGVLRPRRQADTARHHAHHQDRDRRLCQWAHRRSPRHIRRLQEHDACRRRSWSRCCR